jgi:tripartite-type tricarboxylate transporter receptor subunit TctC
MGGQVQLVCEPTGSGLNAAKSGKVKAIAVTAPKQIEEAPGVPAASDTPGLAGYEHSSWLAFFAPTGTPKESVNRLSKEIIAVLSDPDMVARIKKTGFDVVKAGPEELGKIQKQAVDKYAKVVKDAGIKPEAN